MPEQYTNRAQTTLNNGGSLASGATSLVVTSATGFPTSGPFRIIIGSEIIIVGAVSGNTFSSLTRGAESTTDALHADGSVVTHVLTAASLQALPGVTSNFQIKGPSPWIDVKSYGAVGDVQLGVGDGVTTSGSPTLTSSSAPFTAADVGKQIALRGGGTSRNSSADGAMTSGSNVLIATATFTNDDNAKWIKVPNAGVAGADLISRIQMVVSATCVFLENAASSTVSGKTVAIADPLRTTILAYVSASQVTLNTNALSSGIGVFFTWGTDDYAAIQAAIDAATGVVLIPTGSYWLSAALSLPDSFGISIRGSGVGATILYVGSGTADGIAVGDGTAVPENVAITDLTLQGVATKTAGAMIHVRNGHNIHVSNIRLKDQSYEGLLLEGGPNAFSYYIENIEINRGTYGIRIGNEFQSGISPQDISIHRVLIASCRIGLYVTEVSGLYLSNFDTINCSNHGVKFEALAGKIINWVWCTEILADSTGDGLPAAEANDHHGWYITGASTGLIRGIFLTSCWASLNCTAGASSGLVADFAGNGTTTGTINLRIIGGGWLVNGAYGLLISGVKHWSISGAEILSNSQAGSGTYHGVGIAANASNWQIINNRIGSGAGFTNFQGYGIIVTSGCDNYEILGNDLTGNVTGGIIDLASGVNRQVFANLPAEADVQYTPGFAISRLELKDTGAVLDKYLQVNTGFFEVLANDGTTALLRITEGPVVHIWGLRLGDSATAGHVLTTDVNGLATWQGLSFASVTKWGNN